MIPRVFHFIWIGPEPLADRHRDNIEGWCRNHPDWEVRLWGNDDIPPLQNQEQFDAASSWAGRCDIARYEIVHGHGGVYLDVDMVSLKPIDPLLEGCDSFLARSNPDGRISNGIFGSTPRGAFLAQVIDRLPRRFHPRKPDRTGPGLFTRVGRMSPDTRVFEQEIFYPVSFERRSSLKGKRDFPHAYAFHEFDATWLAESDGVSRPGLLGRIAGRFGR